MYRHALTFASLVAAISIASGATAQEQAGSRPNPNPGSSTGTAVPRGGESGGTSAGASSTSGGSSASSGSGGSSGGGSYGTSRTSNEQAALRGMASSRAVGSLGAGSLSDETGRPPVPSYSRPREGRNVLGTAVDRGDLGSGSGNPPLVGVRPPVWIVYDPYYYGYYDPFYSRYDNYGFGWSSCWSPGFGYGLGYYCYDPYAYGGVYGYDPYQGYGSSARYGEKYREVGGLQLKVKPDNTQVYIDGYYVGLVGNFDGKYERMDIEAGPHRIELRAEGYQTEQIDVAVKPGEKITYKGEMRRIK